jgi:hypothetical protein
MTDTIDWELVQEQDREALQREHQVYEQSENVFSKTKITILAFLSTREKHRLERVESLPLSTYGLTCMDSAAIRHKLRAMIGGDDPFEPEFGAAFEEIVFEVKRCHTGTPDSVIIDVLRSLADEGTIYRENGMIGTDQVRVFRLDLTPPSEQKTKALRERRNRPRSILRLEASSRERFIDVEPLSDSESRTLLCNLREAKAARPKERSQSARPVKKKKRRKRATRTTPTAKQLEAQALRLKGLSFEDIGNQIDITGEAARKRVRGAEKFLGKSKSVRPTQTLAKDCRGQDLTKDHREVAPDDPTATF